jgi:hypothetical protein
VQREEGKKEWEKRRKNKEKEKERVLGKRVKERQRPCRDCGACDQERQRPERTRPRKNNSIL